MQPEISGFFSTAATAMQSETGRVLIVAAFAGLTAAAMVYQLFRNGFDFQARFRPVMRKRNIRRKRKP